jgi:hypothetical protein
MGITKCIHHTKPGVSGGLHKARLQFLHASSALSMKPGALTLGFAKLPSLFSGFAFGFSDVAEI